MPDTRHLGIILSPDLVSSLREAGQAMESVDKIVGGDRQLLGFTDFREDGPYATSTLYVTSQRSWEALVQRLDEVRTAWAVESRTLQYKNRKKWEKLWEPAIDPWLGAIRDTPGLAVCVAFSKEFRSSPDYREFLANATKKLRESRSSLTGKSLAASVLKLAPFLVVAPALPKRGAFSWYCDHDALTSGAMGDTFMEHALSNLQLGGSNITLLFPSYPQEVRLPGNVQLALSVPDLVCGVLSDWLPERQGTTTATNTRLDRAGFRILAGLAQFAGATEPDGPPGRLHISIVDRTDVGWIHDPIKLNAS